MDHIQNFKNFLESRGSSKVTIKNYLADIRKFINWYTNTEKTGFNPTLITQSILDAYKKDLSGSYSSTERYFSSLRKFFSYLEDNQQISVNPFKSQESVPVSVDMWDMGGFKNSLRINKASDLTVKNYVLDIKQFLSWLEEVDTKTSNDNNYAAVTTDAIEEYKQRLLQEMNLSPVSINRKLSSLRKYVSFLHAANKLKETPLVLNQDAQIGKNPSKAIISTAHSFIPVTQAVAAGIAAVGEKEVKTIADEPTPEQSLDGSLSALSSPLLATSYSSIPPVRLLQKIAAGMNIFFEASVIAPLTHLVEKSHLMFRKSQGAKGLFSEIATHPEKTSLSIADKFKQFGKSANFDPIKGFITQGHNIRGSVSNISKSFYAPLAVSVDHLPRHKQILHHMRNTRPDWYHKYHAYPVTHYLHFAVLMIFITVIGASMYSVFFDSGKKSPALAALPTAPPRILSFQGRLTDASDNPITTYKNVRFAIYDDITATGSGNLLWQELQGVSPDQDGVFSVLMGNGSSCGSPLTPATGLCAIPSTLFSENAALYLGITIENDTELTPRQQVATVAYAINSETLQGLPPSTAGGAGTSNVVLALDSSGNLTIGGSATPTFQASGGQFTLSGTVLTLKTTAGSNSNVQVNPDGIGRIDLSKPIINSTQNSLLSTTRGAVHIDDLLAIVATSSGQSALTINQDSTGPLISASTSGTAMFTVDGAGNGYYAGNVGIGSTAPSAKLDVVGTLKASGVVTFSNYTNNGGLLYTNGSGIVAQTTVGGSGQCLQSIGGGAPTWGTCGSGSNWTQTLGALHPNILSLDLLIGGNSTTSAKFGFINVNSGTPTATISGNFGLQVPTGSAPAVSQNILNGGTFALKTSVGGDAGLATRLFVTNNGNIGIGTTSSSSRLDVISSAVNTDVQRWMATDGSRLGRLTETSGGAGWFEVDNASGVAQALLRGDGGASYILSGNFGIGTSVPLAPLDVNGAASISGSLTFRAGASTIQASENSTLTIGGNSTGNITLAPFNTTVGGSVTPAATNATDLGTAALQWRNVYGQNFYQNGVLLNLTNYWQRALGAVAPYSITDDVLVGGSATASAKIRLGGTTNADSFFNTGGNVGIGTTTPGQELDVNGDILVGANSIIDTRAAGTLTIGSTTQTGLTLGRAGATTTINGSTLTVGPTSWTATPTISGLITATSGLTANGALTANAAFTLGDNGDLGSINTSDWDISTTGVMTGITGITNDDVYTQTGSSQNTFTGNVDATSGLDVSGASLTVGGANFSVTTAGLVTTADDIAINGGDLTTSGSSFNLLNTNATSINFAGAATGTLAIGNTSGTTNLLGANVRLGSSTTGINVTAAGIISDIDGDVTVQDNLVPQATNTYDIGTAALQWRNVYGQNFYQNGVLLNLTNYWGSTNGALYPTNATLDLLIGGNATSSAKFGFINVAGGTPIASISANSGNNGIYITGDGTVGRPNKGDLALGNSSIYNTTGNTLINSNGVGNVGIGTTTPTTPLDVTGKIRQYVNDVMVLDSPVENGTLRGLSIRAGGLESAGIQVNTTGAVRIGAFRISYFPTFYSNNAEAMRISTTGNVGIGTTAPTALLDVNGAASASGSLTFRAGASTIQSTTNSTLTIGGNSTGNITLAPFNTTVGGAVVPAAMNATDLGTTALQFRNINAQNYYQNGVAINVTNYWQRALGAVAPYNTTDDVLVGGSATASALIKLGGTTNATSFFNTGGNVGIGSTAPTNKVDLVAGTLLSTQNALSVTGTLDTTNTAQTGMTLSITGAGSGAAANQTALAVTLNAGYTGSALTTGGSATNLSVGTGADFTGAAYNAGFFGQARGTTTGDNVGLQGIARGGDLNIGQNGRAVIAKNGATNIGVVGLGLNTGSTPIHIGGYFGLQSSKPTFESAAIIADNGGTTSPLLLLRDNGTSVFSVIDGGNVGIGTTAPGQELDVNGDILVAGGGIIDTRAAGTLAIGGTTQTGLTLGRAGATTTINGGASSVIDFGNFDVTAAGLVTTADDVAINGGDLTTSGSSFNLLNTNATSINFAGAATGTLAIGNTSGTTNLLGGNVRLGDTSNGINITSAGIISDLNGNVTVQDHLVPQANTTFDLGTASLQWNNIYGINYYQNGVLVDMTNYWQRNNGAVTPYQVTNDLLLGGISTASAKFAFINVAAGTPTASISGNFALAVPTGSTPAITQTAFNGGSINFQTSVGGDAGATSRLFISNAGNVGIGTTTTIGKLDIQDTLASDYSRVNIRNAASTGGSAFILGNDTGNTQAAFFLNGSGVGNYAGANSFNMINIANAPLGLGVNNSVKVTIAATSGLVTLVDDIAINGGDLTTSGSSFNLLTTNATSINFASAATGTLAIGNTSGTTNLLGANVRLGSTTTGLNITAAGIISDIDDDVTVQDHLDPQATNTYDLGSAALQWRNIYGQAFYQNGVLLDLVNYWQRNNGAVTPYQITNDLLLGGISTDSAKFAFINVAGGTPTASIAGNLAIAVPTGAAPATTYSALDGGSINFQTSVGGDAGVTSRLFIANNGNVGIGSSSPTNRFVLALGTNQIAQLNDASSSSGIWGQNIGFLSQSSLAQITTNASTPLVFLTGGTINSMTAGTERMRLDTNGNLGIGTTAPGGRLHVETSSSTLLGKAALILNQNENVDIMAASRSGSTVFRLDNTGQVISSAFLDLNNTEYFLNPASGTVGLNVAGGINIGDNGNGNSNLLANAGSLISPSGGIGRFQNLLLQSETLNVSPWTNEGTALSVATTNDPATFSPDGQTNAEKLTSSGARAIYRQDAAASASNTYTFSLWVKKSAGTGTINLSLSDVTPTNSISTASASIDLSTSVSTTWQRYTVTKTLTGTATVARAIIDLNGSGKDIWVWGAQLELQPYSSTCSLPSGCSAGVYASTDTTGFTTTERGAVVNGRIAQSVGVADITSYLQTNARQLASTTALNPGITVYGGTSPSYNYGMDLAYNGTYRNRIFAGVSADIAFSVQNTTPATLQSHFTELMTIKSSGNVGIGTTAPTSAQGFTRAVGLYTTTGNIALTMRTSATTFEGSLGTDGAGLYLDAAGHATATNNNLIFRTEETNSGVTPTERMRIKSDGNVGIGNTNPGGLLQVGSGATPALVGTNTINLLHSTSAYLSVKSGTNAEVFLGSDAVGYGTVGTVSNHNLGFRANNTLAMTVTTGGNIGIGTSVPSRQLSLQSSSNNVYMSFLNAGVEKWVIGQEAAGSDRLVIYNASAPGGYAMTFLTNGNVGIGSATASFPLQVARANGGQWVGQFTNTSAGGATVYMAHQGYGMHIDAGTSATASTYALQIIGNNATHFFVEGAGDVGIGTTNPTNKLDITTLGGANYGSGISINGLAALSSPSGDSYLRLNQNNSFSSGVYTPGALRGDGNVFAGTALYIGAGVTTNTAISGNQFYCNNASACYYNFSGTGHTIVGNGNVGIGTTAPQYKFITQGSGATSVASIYNSTNTDNGALATLNLLLATTATGTNSRFLKFYAGCSDSVTCTNGVGRVRLANGNVAYETGAADFGEWVDMGEESDFGDIIGLTDSKGVKATDKTTLIGVASDTTGFTGNAKADDLGAHQQVVGLLGQIKTKVSLLNGSIKRGDLISASSIPGVGQKATNAGEIVGKALDDFNPTDPNQVIFCPVGTDPSIICGKILVYVSPSWYDPDVYLTNSGDLNITQNAGEYTLTNNGSSVSRIGSFASAVIGTIQAGSITAYVIVTDTFEATTATISQLTVSSLNLTSANLTIAGQNINDFIDARVNSLLDDRLANLTSPLASDSATVTAGKIIVRAPIATDEPILEVDGNASISGKLTANGLSANEISANSASISGTLYAQNIVTDNLTSMEARIATLAATTIYNNITNVSTNSGVATPSAEFIASLYSSGIQTQYADIASLSAQIGFVPEFRSDFVTINQGLIALGPSSLADTAITGQLSINGNMILSENSVNVLGANFEIQPLRQGGVSIMGGLISFDTDGNMRVDGNGEFGGSLTVKGLLATNYISPLPGNNLTVQLQDNTSFMIADASGSAKFQVDAKGNVAASGSASFKDLIANGLNIVRGAQADTSFLETTASGSAGTAIINANQTERTIVTPYVSEKSLIYITATSDTQGVTPYVARQTAQDPEGLLGNGPTVGSFTIQIPHYVSQNITLNWWIVN